MRRLLIALLVAVALSLPSISYAVQRWTIEPSLPDYSKRGMETGSLSNLYEATRHNDRIEISTPFMDPSKPMLAPGQPLNPYELKTRE